jgi:hypothetical protein
MPRSLRWALLSLSLGAAAAWAGVDPRGWTTGGTPAAETAAALAGPAVRSIAFPKELIREVDRPTVLVYFSPTCPHCQDVAAELVALAARLEPLGAKVLGVATGSTTDEAIRQFRADYGVTFPIRIDVDRGISQAMAARSTPSVMLVRPSSDKEQLEVVDLWYPYVNGIDALVEGRVRGDLMAVMAEPRYHGTVACGVCHRQELEAWQLTHHAVAWNTLERKESTADPACVGCHVTGKGEPSGWAGEPHSKLQDVGCEACHGPAGPHDGATTDPSASCAGCHDAKHSLGFQLEVALPLIDHYRATALSEDEVRARRVALHNGSAPQELIRFAGGKNLGAAACVECHPVEHAAWVEDPHSRAMRTLAAKGSAADPACVRCHATAKEAGFPPPTVAEYRTYEGVGCESCHGPAEKHVASGGAPGTIEGLGDDCPVCVIEAVCTSCHDPANDPTWDLDEDLPKVRHTPR